MSEQQSATEVVAALMSAVTLEDNPLFDLAPSGVLAVDGDGTIVYANAPLLRMFGYARGDLLGKPLEMLIPSRLAETHRAHRRRYSQDPRDRVMGSTPARFTGVRSDGTEFPADIALGTVQRNGVAVTFAAVADLSERRSVESRLTDVSRAYRTLEAMTRHMSGAQGMAGVLEVACNLAVVEGRYFGAWAGRATEDGRIEVVASADSVKSYVDGLRLWMDFDNPGPVAVALTQGRPTFIENFDEHVDDTPWIAAARQNGIRASATLPIRCDSEVVAALTFFTDRPDVFNAEVRSVLEGIAGAVRTYLEHAAVDARARTLERHRSQLLQRLVAVQERERAKIAADVHDDSIGTLVAVQLRLKLLEERISSAAPELAGEIGNLNEAMDQATARLRALLFDLDRPDPAMDLVEAMSSAAAFIFAETPVEWDVHGEIGRTVDETSFIQAVRIVKEALANVRAHAHAGHVDVSLREDSGGLEIVVQDDGVGIDRSTPGPRPGHRGLTTMQDRAEMAGGRFDIRSDDKGTEVRVWLPTVSATVL